MGWRNMVITIVSKMSKTIRMVNTVNKKWKGEIYLRYHKSKILPKTFDAAKITRICFFALKLKKLSFSRDKNIYF